MKQLKYLLLILTTITLVSSCKKDNEPSLVLDQTALYFSEWGAPAQTISFVPTNTMRVAQVSISDGFDCFIDNNRHIIVVTPSGDDEGKNDELPTNGTLHVNAISAAGETTGYTIYLYICQEEVLDKDQKYANCYIASTPGIKYSFDATHRPDGTPLNTTSAKLLWQSNSRVIKNTNFKDGIGSFFVEATDEDATKVVNTNGVIAAYNKGGEIVWSWHIWVVDENPENDTHTYSNGKTFMSKNLGAFTNSNGDSSTEKIYDSYGLYYQWGRKDPFPRPGEYNCAAGTGETIYNEDGTYYAKELTKEISSTTGCVDYAIANPMQFITNPDCIEEGGDGIGDWLVTANNTLWSDDTKSVYDPCPAGWKVPSASDLEVLFLSETEDATDLDKARKQYGWNLSDGVQSFFYNACGYYRFNDGKIQNMNYKEGVYPSTPEPWEGYYWTTTSKADGSAVSLYFDLTTTRSINKFEKRKDSRRANGMQVRCVKIQ